jgi:hypothetical protein
MHTSDGEIVALRLLMAAFGGNPGPLHEAHVSTSGSSPLGFSGLMTRRTGVCSTGSVMWVASHESITRTISNPPSDPVPFGSAERLGD